jgi:hypothetical protein
MLIAIELTEGLAKIASGSILVTALVLALAAFNAKAGATWFKALTLVVAAAVVVVAIVLFTGTERAKASNDSKAARDARECKALLATVRQGLKDKLLFEDDIEAAKNIAQSLMADMDASGCKPGE